MLTIASPEPGDWLLASAVDANRRDALVGHAPPAREVLRLFADEALAAAERGRIELEWIEACDPDAPPGHFRIEATVPLSTEVYDLFFNGRTGYRAAYWVSVFDGMLFNIAALRAAEPAIRRTYERGPVAVSWETVRTTLLGEHSKLWTAEAGTEFVPEKSGLLIPPRWRERAGSGVGTCLPVPRRPGVEVKGTFTQVDGNAWLDPCKADRHLRLHRIGHT
jgi:hypothetical protein